MVCEGLTSVKALCVRRLYFEGIEITLDLSVIPRRDFLLANGLAQALLDLADGILIRLLRFTRLGDRIGLPFKERLARREVGFRFLRLESGL